MDIHPCITVFCGRYYGNNQNRYQTIAQNTGRLLGENGYTVATGGGNGQMDDVAHAAFETGTKVISVQLNHRSQTQSTYYTVKESYDSIDERQKSLITKADGFIILPGGLGTLYELTEILLKKTLGIIDMKKPIILVDKSYYKPIYDFLLKGEEEGFFKEKLTNLWAVVDTPDEAIKLLNKFFNK